MIRPHFRTWRHFQWHRRWRNLCCITPRDSSSDAKYREEEGQVGLGQLGVGLGLVLELARVVHVPLGEVGDLGFPEHGRPILRLLQVLRGDEGIFSPVGQDEEAMAPQNISVCLSG